MVKPGDADAEKLKAKYDAENPKKREGPKRPSSSFMYFSQALRERVNRENPQVTRSQILVILGEMWTKMTDEEKLPFVQAAEKDKERLKNFQRKSASEIRSLKQEVAALKKEAQAVKQEADRYRVFVDETLTAYKVVADGDKKGADEITRHISKYLEMPLLIKISSS